MAQAAPAAQPKASSRAKEATATTRPPAKPPAQASVTVSVTASATASVTASVTPEKTTLLAKDLSPKAASDQEVILTDAEGRRYCRVKECDQAAMVESYCRYHYLLFWKRIQVRKKILSEGKLERYVEELTARYPDKYLEMIRRDLKTEKDFLGAIQELEIDDSGSDNDYEDEAQSFIDEVRGISSETGAREDEEY